MTIYFIFLIIFLLNLFIFLKFKDLSKIYVLFDKPDRKLKKHKNSVSLIGGFIILINLYIIIFLLKFLNLDNIIFDGNFSYIILILGSIFFLIGFIDDIKNLSPNIKAAGDSPKKSSPIRKA